MSPGPTVADLGERALIERIGARLPAAPAWVAVGIGDDAAVRRAGAQPRSRCSRPTRSSRACTSTGAFVPPAAIGHKALAVNLSDLAAMGAEPRAALLSLVLPGAMTRRRLRRDDRRLPGARGAATRVALVGGNIARSPGPLVLDVTAIGTVQAAAGAHARRARGRATSSTSAASVGAACAGFLASRRGGLRRRWRRRRPRPASRRDGGLRRAVPAAGPARPARAAARPEPGRLGLRRSERRPRRRGRADRRRRAASARRSTATRCRCPTRRAGGSRAARARRARGGRCRAARTTSCCSRCPRGGGARSAAVMRLAGRRALHAHRHDHRGPPPRRRARGARRTPLPAGFAHFR